MSPAPKQAPTVATPPQQSHHPEALAFALMLRAELESGRLRCVGATPSGTELYVWDGAPPGMRCVAVAATTQVAARTTQATTTTQRRGDA